MLFHVSRVKITCFPLILFILKNCDWNLSDKLRMYIKCRIYLDDIKSTKNEDLVSTDAP